VFVKWGQLQLQLAGCKLRFGSVICCEKLNKKGYASTLFRRSISACSQALGVDNLTHSFLFKR
jgi:hypothetical protein